MGRLPSPLEIDFDSSASTFEEKPWYRRAESPFLFNFEELYLCEYFIEFHQTVCQNIWGIGGPHCVAWIFCRNFWQKFRQHFQNLDFYFQKIVNFFIFEDSIFDRLGCAWSEISVWAYPNRSYKSNYNCNLSHMTCSNAVIMNFWAVFWRIYWLRTK